MRLKTRTMPVIVFSSLVITMVLGFTLFGFYAYLEWKAQNIDQGYALALYDLKAGLFQKYIALNIKPRIGASGVFRGKPIIEGTIANNSGKKIYSIKLKIAFYDKRQKTLYIDTFYPVGPDFESLIKFGVDTENYLREGDSVSFKHQLKNCPKEISEYLKGKLRLAKTGPADEIRFEYKIEGMDIR